MNRNHPGRILAHPATVVTVWLLTRIFTVALVGTQQYLRHMAGDVTYYLTQLDRWDANGVQAVLVEYPTPVAYGLKGLELVTGPTSSAYTVGFVAAMLLLDAGFTIALWRTPLGTRAVWFWVMFLPLVGPLAYFRFDLLPAVLAGLALLWATRRPIASGALIGLGAATKLWPALLVLPLLGPRKSRGRALAGFAGCGFGLAALSLALGGWGRLISPLTWQSDRGLQIEAVSATVPMLSWGFGSGEYTVWYSNFNAYEIAGPWVDRLLVAGDVLFAAGLLVIAWLVWRLLRSGTPTPGTVAVVMLAVIAIVIVTNKTLSPQYVIWLGGPLAAMLTAPDTEPTAGPAPARTTVQLFATVTLIVATLTHMVFPIAYPHLIKSTSLSPASVTVLAARNLALVAYAAWSCVLAFRLTPRGGRSPSTCPAE